MKCIICYENMKAEGGGKVTNWTQRCITCKDSWVCGRCYHTWDNNIQSSVYKVMPCVMCRKPMNYSHLVNRFDEGTGGGWWDDIDDEKPIHKYLYEKMMDQMYYTLYDDEEVVVDVNCPHADCDINELWKYKPEEKQFCHFYGKDIELPRKMLTLGETYDFNGSNPSVGKLEDFGYLSKCILLAQPMSPYNSCVVNFYEDGNEYIGYHRDRTNGMTKDSTIVICSFGETRTLRLQHIVSRKSYDIPLPHGSRFEFTQDFNNRYKHMIVKSKKIKEKRISITYRNMK